MHDEKWLKQALSSWARSISFTSRNRLIRVTIEHFQNREIMHSDWCSMASFGRILFFFADLESSWWELSEGCHPFHHKWAESAQKVKKLQKIMIFSNFEQNHVKIHRFCWFFQFLSTFHSILMKMSGTVLKALIKSFLNLSKKSKSDQNSRCYIKMNVIFHVHACDVCSAKSAKLKIN